MIQSMSSYAHEVLVSSHDFIRDFSRELRRKQYDIGYEMDCWNEQITRRQLAFGARLPTDEEKGLFSRSRRTVNGVR